MVIFLLYPDLIILKLRFLININSIKPVLITGYRITQTGNGMISQKFISSQSTLGIYSKELFNKNCKGHQPNEGYGIKSQNYAVIWSQKFVCQNLN